MERNHQGSAVLAFLEAWHWGGVGQAGVGSATAHSALDRAVILQLGSKMVCAPSKDSPATSGQFHSSKAKQG